MLKKLLGIIIASSFAVSTAFAVNPATPTTKANVTKVATSKHHRKIVKVEKSMPQQAQTGKKKVRKASKKPAAPAQQAQKAKKKVSHKNMVKKEGAPQ